MTATVDLATAAGGGPLEDDVWDVFFRLIGIGYAATRRVFLDPDTPAAGALVDGRGAVAFATRNGDLALDLSGQHRTVAGASTATPADLTAEPGRAADRTARRARHRRDRPAGHGPAQAHRAPRTPGRPGGRGGPRDRRRAGRQRRGEGDRRRQDRGPVVPAGPAAEAGRRAAAPRRPQAARAGWPTAFEADRCTVFFPLPAGPRPATSACTAPRDDLCTRSDPTT